jgi:hypothetical protein
VRGDKAGQIFFFLELYLANSAPAKDVRWDGLRYK